METKLVLDLAPVSGNGRNSEGSFLRAHDGSIMFAYSRFCSNDSGDDASCEIALIRSYDEGDTWSAYETIAKGSDFGVKNIMSVSGVVQRDGSFGFYFLIKENDGTSTLGRAVSADGGYFKVSRCKCGFQRAYYVVNNDRIERLSDGRLAVPASMAYVSSDENGLPRYDWNFTAVCIVSDDDGEQFYTMPPRISLTNRHNYRCGMQEPGLLELDGGLIWLWARTECGFQYECFSRDGMRTFTSPEPSEFTSPCSPMEVARSSDGELYAVYNPIPNYNGRNTDISWGRTPLVIRRSKDGGKSWGKCNIIEGRENRGYCYPSVFFTKDNSLLCAYCRGSAEDKICLARLGITKIPLTEII